MNREQTEFTPAAATPPEWAGPGRDSHSPDPAPVAPDTLCEQRLARLRSFRQPRVEELEPISRLERL